MLATPNVAASARNSRVAPTRSCRIDLPPQPAPSVARPSSGIDQRDAEVRALATAQMRRRLDDGDFQGRPHDPLEEMATPRRAVVEAQHRVQMQAGLAIVAHL